MVVNSHKLAAISDESSSAENSLAIVIFVGFCSSYHCWSSSLLVGTVVVSGSQSLEQQLNYPKTEGLQSEEGHLRNSLKINKFSCPLINTVNFYPLYNENIHL